MTVLCVANAVCVSFRLFRFSYGWYWFFFARRWLFCGFQWNGKNRNCLSHLFWMFFCSFICLIVWRRVSEICTIDMYGGIFNGWTFCHVYHQIERTGHSCHDNSKWASWNQHINRDEFVFSKPFQPRILCQLFKIDRTKRLDQPAINKSGSHIPAFWKIKLNHMTGREKSAVNLLKTNTMHNHMTYVIFEMHVTVIFMVAIRSQQLMSMWYDCGELIKAAFVNNLSELHMKRSNERVKSVMTASANCSSIITTLL